MPRKSSIHGIFLAVELDKTKFEKDVSDLLTHMEGVNQQLGKPITPRLDSDSMQKSLNGMMLSLDKMINHGKNLGQVFTELPKIFTAGGAALQAKFETLGQTIGMTGDEIKNIFTEAFKTGEIKNALTAIEGFRRAIGFSKEQMLSLVEGMKGMPVEVVEALRDKVTATGQSASSLLDEFKKVETSIKALSEAENLTNQSAVVQRLANQYHIADEEARRLIQAQIRMGNERAVIDYFIRLRDATGRTNDQIIQLARNMGVAQGTINALAPALRRTEKGFFAVIRDLITTNNLAAAVQSILATLGANISLAGITELVKSMYRTNVELNTLNVAFQSVQGNAFEAGAKLAFIRQECDSLGLHFMETARAAKNFYAAANQSAVAKDADKIFHAFTSAATALHLTKEETSGMFVALSQMMSKGKITAEELRQQLGERLPGAVQMLAAAMGKSTQELDKMLQKGEVGLENLVKLADRINDQYGIAAKNASTSIIAEMNRVANAWTDFKQKFAVAEGFAWVLRLIKSLIEFFTEWGGVIIHVSMILGEFLLTGRLVGTLASGLIKRLGGLKDSLSLIVVAGKTAIDVFKTLNFSIASVTKVGENLAALFGIIGTGGAVATAGWLGLIGTLGLVSYTLYSWYQSTHQASEGLKELEKTYNNLKLEKKNVEVEVNGVKVNRAELEKSSQQIVDDLNKFFENRKVEVKLDLREAEEKLAVLKKSLSAGTGFFADLFASDADKAIIENLKSQIAELEKKIADMKTGYKESEIAQTDFMKSAMSLADTVKTGNMTKEEAIEKLMKLRDETLNTQGATGQFKAAILAAIPAIISLINQNDALALSMGGIAQAAREARAEVRALYRAGDFGGQIAKLEAQVALGKSGDSLFRGKNGKRLREDFANRWGDMILPGMEAYKQEGKEGVINAFRKRFSDTNSLPKTLRNKIDALPENERAAFKESEAVNLGTKLYQELVDAPRLKKLEDQLDAMNKPEKSGTKKKKKPSAKSVMAQDKKDTGVLDMINALTDEKALLLDIQRIGEDNTVAQSFLNIEQTVLKAEKAAAKYKTTNKDATDQAKVAEAARLMVENANIKALTQRNKLIEDNKKKVLELISAYNEEYGIHNEEKMRLINDEYTKQIRELESLLEGYNKQIETLDLLIQKYKDLGDAKMVAEYGARRDKLVQNKAQTEIDIKKLEEQKRIQAEQDKLNAQTGIEASVKQALLAYDKANANVTEKMKNLWVDSLTTMGDSLADFISSGLTGFSDLGEAFKELASSMLKDMTRIMMHQFVRYLIQGMFGSSIPFGGGGGGFATGGVLSGGNISSYRNTIVSQRTSFSYGSQRFAKGGIMGEAGPEAVMPLTRTADGNLGVRSVGSNGNDSGDNVTVNVYNYGNEKAKTRSSKDAHGGRTIDVIIGDIAAQQMTTPGTKLNRTVTAQTGSSQPVIRR